MPLPDFVRVRDKRTGHEHSTRHPHPEHHQTLKRPAVDRQGRALPPKPRVALARPEKADTPADNEKE